MKPILLVIGSPASGKSTLARAIAKQSPKGLHIPVDDLRNMVQGGVVLPGPEWPPELTEQLSLARQTAAEMALRYRSSGFLVAIDDFWDPNSRLQEYIPLASHANVVRVILKPDDRVILSRLHARQAPSAFRNILDGAIQLVNADLDRQAASLRSQGWRFIDTSNDTIEESTARILELLKSCADQPLPAS